MTEEASTIQPQSQNPEPIADSSKPRAARTKASIPDKIRMELNIEKWPSIWQPSKSKNRPALRTLEREVTDSDGNRMVSRVEVGFTQLGTLTTEDQKTMYALVRLWEEQGKPNAQVFFSARKLAALLRKKGWGTNVIDAITKSLRKLRTVPIEWINSYYDKTNSGTVLRDRTPFMMLSQLRIIERETDGAVNSSLGYFKFDDHLLANLMLNFTKPVLIDEFFRLKSEIAQLIYTHIDLVMFDKQRYERKSKELFDDLGLNNPEYAHMYERKRALVKALKELVGIPMSSGVLKSAEIEKTKDKSDYKVVFQKGSRATAAPENAAPLELQQPVVINHYAEQKDAVQIEAEELVKYFHKLFHAGEYRGSESKQIAQATTLISRHGSAQARHIVDFSHRAAKETKYDPQFFGGILQYTSQGLADYGRVRADHERRSASSSASLTEPPAPKEIASAEPSPIDALSDEQREALYARAKEQLFARNPFLARHAQGKSIMIDAMIRGQMIKELGQQRGAQENPVGEGEGSKPQVEKDEVVPATATIGSGASNEALEEELRVGPTVDTYPQNSDFMETARQDADSADREAKAGEASAGSKIPEDKTR